MSLQALCALNIKKNNTNYSNLPTKLKKFIKNIEQCCISQNTVIAMNFSHLLCIPDEITDKMMEYAICNRLYTVIDYFLSKGKELPSWTSLHAVCNDDLELVQYSQAKNCLHPATLFDAAMLGNIDIVKFCSQYLPVGIELLEIAAMYDDVELFALCYDNGINSDQLIYNSLEYYHSYGCIEAMREL